ILSLSCFRIQSRTSGLFSPSSQPRLCTSFTIHFFLLCFVSTQPSPASYAARQKAKYAKKKIWEAVRGRMKNNTIWRESRKRLSRSRRDVGYRWLSGVVITSCVVGRRNTGARRGRRPNEEFTEQST